MTNLLTEADVRRIVREELARIEDERTEEMERAHEAGMDAITDTYGSGD